MRHGSRPRLRARHGRPPGRTGRGRSAERRSRRTGAPRPTPRRETAAALPASGRWVGTPGSRSRRRRSRAGCAYVRFAPRGSPVVPDVNTITPGSAASNRSGDVVRIGNDRSSIAISCRSGSACASSVANPVARGPFAPSCSSSLTSDRRSIGASSPGVSLRLSGTRVAPARRAAWIAITASRVSRARSAARPPTPGPRRWARLEACANSLPPGPLARAVPERRSLRSVLSDRDERVDHAHHQGVRYRLGVEGDPQPRSDGPRHASVDDRQPSPDEVRLERGCRYRGRAHGRRGWSRRHGARHTGRPPSRRAWRWSQPPSPSRRHAPSRRPPSDHPHARA